MKKSTKLIIALIIVGVMLSLVTFWVVWRDRFNGKINKIDVDVVEEEKTPTIIYNTYHNEVYHNEVYYGSEKTESTTPVNNKPCEQKEYVVNYPVYENDYHYYYAPTCPCGKTYCNHIYHKYSFGDLVREYDDCETRRNFNRHMGEYVEFTCYLVQISDRYCLLSSTYGTNIGGCHIYATYENNNIMKGFVYMTTENSRCSCKPVTVRGIVTSINESSIYVNMNIELIEIGF